MSKIATFRDGKEAEFERDFLHYASAKYRCTPTQSWTVTVLPLPPERWMDLWDVSRHSFMESGAETWHECDAWSTAWDVPAGTGWRHIRDKNERLQLATRMELTSFDQRIAARAADYDLVTFTNHDLLNCLAALHPPWYIGYVLGHEAIHEIQDWSGKTLIVDHVSPGQDSQVIKTLRQFIASVGGWSSIEDRYLL